MHLAAQLFRRLASTSGLLLALLIIPPPTSMQAQGSETTRFAVVTAASVNIRKDASTKAAVIGKVTKDERVAVLDERTDWIRIQTGTGTQGWAAKKYFVFVSDDDPATTKPETRLPVTNPPPVYESGNTFSDSENSAGRESVSGAHGRMRFGVAAGATYAQLGGEDATDAFGARIGIEAGLVCRIPIAGFWSAHGELLYAQQGAVLDRAGGKRSLLFDYAVLPAGLSYTAPLGSTFEVYVAGGGFISYVSRSSVQSDAAQAELQKITDLRSIDAGVQAGLGMMMSVGRMTLLVEAQYRHGLTGVHDDADPLDLRTRTISAKTGILW